MKTKIPDEQFIEKAKQLSEDEAELILSRMKGKLQRRFEDKLLDKIEVLALQLEIENEKLAEWRARMTEIRQAEEQKAKKNKASKA